MYVYLVVAWRRKNGCRIEKIFSTKKAAEQCAMRLNKKEFNFVETAILKKKIYGDITTFERFVENTEISKVVIIKN